MRDVMIMQNETQNVKMGARKNSRHILFPSRTRKNFRAMTQPQEIHAMTQPQEIRANRFEM